MTSISSLTFGQFTAPLQVRVSTQILQKEMNCAQSELSSGQRGDPGAVLGGQIGYAVTMRQTLNQADSLLNANSAFCARMKTMDVSMNAIRDVIQKTRDEAVTAMTTGASTAVASTARMSFGMATTALNARVGEDYVFSGQKSDAAPMIGDPSSGPAKAAIDQAFTDAFGVSPGSAGAAAITPQAMKDFIKGPFADLFKGTNWSNLWSAASDQPVRSDIGLGRRSEVPANANDDSMKAMAQGFSILSALGLGALNSSTRSAALGEATNLLNGAQDGLINMQARSGLVQRDATLAAQELSAQKNLLQTNIGKLENVDPAEAATRVSQLTTQLETAYALTARLSKLSLTQFI